MSTYDELVPVLKKLRLSGLLQSLEVRCREAADANLCMRCTSPVFRRPDGRRMLAA
ncbi:hypothetical protein [Corallococcus macrosporus]|uniref:Uncharacterized protein n=1 Tax=Corallococcus macrosporus DSM 14697 TaxID=1189310 RepID=A0A250K142_9BACT|nr:hypothetical protein [Corallococcus macrosporus]ATB49301.1 hypothetical protein MYMAC_004944 [Corallococcus macrosporus DSM 14697]